MEGIGQQSLCPQASYHLWLRNTYYSIGCLLSYAMEGGKNEKWIDTDNDTKRSLKREARRGRRYVIVREGRTDSWTMNSCNDHSERNDSFPNDSTSSRVNGKGGLINKEREERESCKRRGREKSDGCNCVTPIAMRELYIFCIRWWIIHKSSE